MGDLITDAVQGKLTWVPAAELSRLLCVSDRFARATLLATACRLNALSMIAQAGSGHIGSSFSCMDIITWLHLEELDESQGDVYFSSKGHDAPALYSLLLALGRLPFDWRRRLRRRGGLPGHPDVGTPGIVTNTGSLGMGISKAKGMALARRQRGQSGRFYVLTGDGELQEGQIWESLVSAVNLKLSEISVIVDHNKLQSDRLVSLTSDLGDLEAKFSAFGWHVQRINGHDFGQLSAALDIAKQQSLPQVIIADTVKGCGVSFMEHTSLDSDNALYRFHSGAPDRDGYLRACSELIMRLEAGLQQRDEPPIALETEQAPVRPVAQSSQRLIDAYSRALRDQMQSQPSVIALDADLAVDTGQMPAREEFSTRWFECGIAEMDMVSTAGGLAREGLLPVCHSFACFLSTRANEQIYNNATEHSKIIYVASLAGLLPGGPGHSHQSVRDISAIGSVPGLLAYEPCTEAEVEAAMRWAVADTEHSVWLRLVSIPYAVPFELPLEYVPQVGRGTVLREGRDALFIGYGPVLLSEAWYAAELLQKHGLDVGVVHLPWLNRVDSSWIARVTSGKRAVFALDNHYVKGGQGDRIGVALAEMKLETPPSLHRFGVEDVPEFGSNAEVLAAHQLDAQSLAHRVVAILQG